MATVQYMLNALMIALTLTSRSSDAVQRAPCHKAFDAYFQNWKVNSASLANLLDQDKELSFEDVNNLFMPICDVHGNYATKQCLMNSYCWCSDPNGELLSGTFQKGKADELDCTKCMVGNTSYTSGDYFKIPETCEACKCENREVICHKYFCSNKTKLSSQELLELKTTILIVLYVQHDSRKSTVPIVNVREEYLATVPLDLALSYNYRKQTLNWKFNMLDINQDDKLNKEYEFNLFMRQIQHFVLSRQVYETIFSLIDEDGDKLISKSEWMDFLDNLSTPDLDGSGSATIDDEESNDASGDSAEVVTRSVKSSRSLPEVMKEFVKKLHKQQRMSHSTDKYF